LADHSPTFDTRELQLVFQQAADAAKADRIFSDQQTVDDRILALFQKAYAIRRRQIAETPVGERAAYLTARGPVLLLGRPRLFPILSRLGTMRPRWAPAHRLSTT
jgi:hypothetical protein